jgi:hypothetical protein
VAAVAAVVCGGAAAGLAVPPAARAEQANVLVEQAAPPAAQAAARSQLQLYANTAQVYSLRVPPDWERKEKAGAGAGQAGAAVGGGTRGEGGEGRASPPRVVGAPSWLRGWVSCDQPTITPGADVLFEDPRRRSTSVGVTVSPVRVTSIDKFGDLAAVGQRLLDAERKKVWRCARVPLAGARPHACRAPPAHPCLRRLVLCMLRAQESTLGVELLASSSRQVRRRHASPAATSRARRAYANPRCPLQPSARAHTPACAAAHTTHHHAAQPHAPHHTTPPTGRLWRAAVRL